MPDPGWVRIYHPDQLEDPDVLPDPDDYDGADNDKFSLVTVDAYNQAWKNRGWRNLDEDRAGASAEDMPKNAADRIKWIDEDESVQAVRAQTALDDEHARDDGGRTTVIEHAEEVLSTPDGDQTNSTTPTEQES